MPIANGGELYPLPLNDGEVLAAWNELRGRLLAQLPDIAAGVERARSGGSQVSGQTDGIETAGGELVDVVLGAAAGGEAGAVAAAGGNAIGVSQDMGRAVGYADDPNTDPGAVDFEAANRAAGYEADGITRDARQLGGYPEPPEEPTGPGRV